LLVVWVRIGEGYVSLAWGESELIDDEVYIFILTLSL
jgi:hypothetical protein